jgi:hypothetical protein
MTQVVYRANLTAAEFPLLSEFQGRSIIVPAQDQNFSRQLTSQRNKDKDVGLPQMYYGHNVIPTDAGFSSVGYLPVGMAPQVADAAFTGIFSIRDVNENVGYFAYTSTGNCYVLLAANTPWLKTTSVAPLAGLSVSTARINGHTYIYFGGVGCYEYTFATNVLTPVTLTPANILGIVAANGFMLAWTATALLNSSTIDPTDFTPSIITAAGGGGIQDAKAAITCVVPHSAGVVIYTKKNAVVGFYTGNNQYPFKYKEIVSSGGVATADVVSFDANTSDHYAYTTSGLEAISAQTSAVIFPQVTDFLAGSQFEDFDETTLTFTNTTLASPMLKRVTVIADRYLILSYGINELTHTLYYDFAMERWGKLKVTHVACFEYSLISPNVVEAPRRSVGFLQADGTVKVLVMSYNTTGSYGVMVLGKYQFERGKYLSLNKVELENIRISDGFTMSLLSSVDGKTNIQKPLVLDYAVNNFRRYKCRSSGINHSLVFAGAFNASSLELSFTEDGNIR